MKRGLILIRGGGDLASGVALRLRRAGLQVVITEIAKPLAVRRTVAFAEAVYSGQVNIEGVTGRLAQAAEIPELLRGDEVPLLIDPDARILNMDSKQWLAVVDARLTKRPPTPLPTHVPLRIGLGPGFRAPADADAVVETQRGHALGRVIWDGSASSDTSQPEGDLRRVLRAPAEGVFKSRASIGQHFELGEIIAAVDDQVIAAPFAGVLRGLLKPGIAASKGMKVGDLDPRDDPSLCYLVSDKALAVGGGVLEAILSKPEIRARLW
ncbi:MAG: EF2563 family selenium-dependent molybdenum hydroxylase system protein [Chloroflexi bacterium]|nr:EF2563 family selenium-dependent molybdenum hydroxylase system protein [Chloroflexota bacterium]